MTIQSATGFCLGRVLLVAAFALAWTAQAAVPLDGSNRSELIRNLLPTVVNITVRKEVVSPTRSQVASAPAPVDSKTFVGSGFVIDPAGQIVTNYHVLEGAFEIAVTLSDGSVLPGRMLYASRLADLAVLQVQAGRPLKPVEWGDSTKVQVGDQVFAIGNPLGIGLSVSAGIVSALNRDVQDSPYDDYIQTDAAINHGNSGGPLFDMEGRVVGVDTALVSLTEASAGVGLAIPSDTVRFVIERLKTYGWVRPGWMGVKVQQMTPDMAAALGLGNPQGSVVSYVMPGSPAEKAGIDIGDVIVRYGSDAPRDERALLREIVRTAVGDTVEVGMLRGGLPHVVPVTIASWPRTQWEARDAPSAVERPRQRVAHDLGLSLAAIKPGERTKLGIGEGEQGVLVSGVAPGSDAARRGMVAGDVIMRVQDWKTVRPADVQPAIDAVRGEKRRFVMLLVLQKERKNIGPSWVALELADPDS